MTLSKEIKVRYYALLREERGQSEEVCTTQAQTPADLYRQLQNLHRLSLSFEQLQVAVNDEFSPWDKLLETGDTVVFLPPVAGG